MSTAAPRRPTPNAPQRQPIASETFSQVQSLAQRIQSMLPKDQSRGQVVGVTSCARREGVSVVAGNLAICASEVSAGNVLLIDANPNNASVASRFGVQHTPGLAECLAGKSTVREGIASTPHPNLYVLPAGLQNPRSTRFADERATALFESLRQGFELIVLDLPPAGEMDEALLASRRVDGVLLVLEAERIRRHFAQRVQRQLEQVNMRLLGVVLNKRKDHVPEWLYRRL
ncbi:MAG: CpsD/CapB family tyrosine-protein kinase [Planctomycetia bacterium]|nr:CpsD/CapB family tyrosine-protein kinase [Planctomycetia bacterium]